MPENLPVIEKRPDEFSTSLKQLKSRIKRLGLKVLATGVGLFGAAQASGPVGGATSPVQVPLQISNRKEKEQPSKLVFQLGTVDKDTRMMTSHRSHRSHSSHYSSRSAPSRSAPSPPPATSPTPPPPPSPPATSSSVSDQQREALPLESGKITEVDVDNKYFTLEGKSGKVYVFYFSDETAIKILSPSEQTVTLAAIKAFSGTMPLREDKTVLVQWKEEGTKKVAVQITIFEL